MIAIHQYLISGLGRTGWLSWLGTGHLICRLILVVGRDLVRIPPVVQILGPCFTGWFWWLGVFGSNLTTGTNHEQNNWSPTVQPYCFKGQVSIVECRITNSWDYLKTIGVILGLQLRAHLLHLEKLSTVWRGGGFEPQISCMEYTCENYCTTKALCNCILSQFFIKCNQSMFDEQIQEKNTNNI